MASHSIEIHMNIGRILQRVAAILPGGFFLLPILIFSAESKILAADEKAPPPLKSSDNNHISIPVQGLGKEYLMSMSIIPQSGAPTSSGLAGKVVHFELFHDGVDMYEGTKGLVVTDDLPARRLITTFDIVSRDDAQVTIDFNQGMRRVFTEGWYGDGNYFNPSALERVEEVHHSRVFEVSESEDQLVIRQTVQTRSRQFDQNREGRYEIRFFIMPYAANDFEAKEMNPYEMRYARFWEIQGQVELESGRVTTKMGRFDIDEPVTFYYSANTPDDYVDAVKDGILYWNRAFGKEIVKAEKAPDGVTAPDARYNVVQWVPWDSAGFAYADVLMDPRTGQALHGQAYMTSVFGISGKARARALMRAMREIADEKDTDKKDGDDKQPNHAALKWLAGQSACQVNPVAFANQMADGLQDLLANAELTDEVVLRASQDYVREVVAHEVGHVIGLRHNFAGSLAATVSPKELDEFMKAYISGKGLEKFKDKEVSNSMMEYSVFKAGVFIGWKMRETENVQPHDRGTIRWGYYDDKAVVTNRMLFATDGDAGTYADVTTFDYGNEPLLAAYSDISDSINTLPNSVIETFIRARAPRDPRDRIPLEKVSLSYSGYAATIARNYTRLLEWFKASTRSLKVENAFDYIGPLNEKERYQAHWNSLTNQISSLGGLDQVAFAWMPADLKLDTKKKPEGVDVALKISATNLTARLEKLLESPAYAYFIGLDEQKYSFTEEEKKVIVERGSKLFEKLEEAVLARVCDVHEKAVRDLALKANGELAEDDAVANLDKRIIDLSKVILLAKDDDKRLKGTVIKSTVEVKEYKYEHATRLAAAKALGDKAGSYTGWSKEAKGELNKKLKAEVDAALNIDQFKSFEESMLSRPLRQWYLEQKEILVLLPPVKSTDTEKSDAKK